MNDIRDKFEDYCDDNGFEGIFKRSSFGYCDHGTHTEYLIYRDIIEQPKDQDIDVIITKFEREIS